jgi:uncharacterized protein DUF5317
MFILYAIVIGLVVGLLLGGQPSRLAELKLRYAWVCVLGLAVQLVLFSDAVTERIGDLGVPIYVVSTVLVAGAVAANYRIPGMAIVALGAFSNLVAIVANGGYMPTTAEALAASGFSEKTVYSNSALLADPKLPWLTDIFAMPRWIPSHNVFSIGDVLIGLGVVIVIVAAMRRPSVTMDGAPAH